MDLNTLNYYNKYYESIVSLYNSNSIKPKYLDILNFSNNHSEKILDVGFGSGRELNFLSQEGYTVYGIEGSDKLIENLLASNPEYSERIKKCILPSDNNPFNVLFDVIICSAVLMHMYDDDIVKTLGSFSMWLNKKSIIYISIPKKRNDIGDDFRDKHGRYFNPVKPEFITKILSQYDFTCSQISSSGDGLSRDGIEWWNLVYERG